MKHLVTKKAISIIAMILGITFTYLHFKYPVTTSLASDKPNAALATSAPPAQSSNKVIQKTSNKEKDKTEVKETAPVLAVENTQTVNESEELNTITSTNKTIQDNTSVHTHNWIPQYTTVHHDVQYNIAHHDATGHYETQTVSEGYYSEEPKYVTGYADKCLGCGLTSVDFGWDSDAFFGHIVATGHTYTMAWGTWQLGTEQVWHDPITQQVWVEDSPAYDEQIKVSDAYDEQLVSGYKCSSCGATK